MEIIVTEGVCVFKRETDGQTETEREKRAIGKERMKFEGKKKKSDSENKNIIG